MVLSGQFGYTNGKYTDLLVDLNNDRVINERDFALKLPRQSPWTYGAAVTLDTPIGNGVLSSRASYSHRDRAFHTDNNLGFYEPYDLFDVNFSYTPASQAVTFSLYGKNLINETMNGNDAVLPDIPSFGGDGAAGPRPLPTFSPLARGRVIGAEVRYTF